MAHIGKHSFVPERIYAGRCGVVVEYLSAGHQRCCGAEKHAPTHIKTCAVADCRDEIDKTAVMCRTHQREANRVEDERHWAEDDLQWTPLVSYPHLTD